MLCARLAEPVAQTVTVRVPEGGTATFGVKLDAPPAGQQVVAVARLSGDHDIGVLSGSELTFTPENWNVYQTVTLVAAEDTDANNGEAVIACSVGSQVQLTVTAIEADRDRDSDGDGLNDADEIRCGTDPDNSASVFTFYPPVTLVDPKRFILRWQSATDQTYTVKATTNLIRGFGLLVATNVAATPPINVYTDTVEGVIQKFYRIER
jgi:hypothetical protein